MVERLFVYGTLGLGRPNEHVLKNIGGKWFDASVKGFLKQEGWGAAMGYPAIELDDNGDEVIGFVFESANLAENWQVLDEFEGEAYKRIKQQVMLANGKQVDAYIYALG
ncbi:MAG: gamma-glutamylcyclotransferase family protein [Psychrobium sp.]